MSLEEDLEEAFTDVTAEDLALLGVANESQIQKRAVFLRMIYTNPRYTPANKEETWARIQILFKRLGIAPKDHSRKVGTYCGNYYLLPNVNLGTLSQCRQKGHRQGDRHGNLNVH